MSDGRCFKNNINYDPVRPFNISENTYEKRIEFMEFDVVPGNVYALSILLSSTTETMSCITEGAQSIRRPIRFNECSQPKLLSSCPMVHKTWEFSKSTLFHRWLLGLTGSSNKRRFEYVEHLNGIALDQIRPEYGDEQADAGWDCRTRFARPNSQARTPTGKYYFSLFS